MSTLASSDSNSMRLHSSLEWKYLQDYLGDNGFQMEIIRMLPVDEAKRIMIDACTHVSLKLAEMESRARFIEKIHSR